MILRIKLTKPPERISPNLLNQRALPSARIDSLYLEPSVWENDDFRPLTEEELDRSVFEREKLQLCGYGDPVEHLAPDGRRFTVRDMIAAVEETERKTRHQSDWFDGIDVHHVFYEGLREVEPGLWKIDWGS